MSEQSNLEMIVMNIVVDSGSARSYAMESIALAKEGKFEEADQALETGKEEIGHAHHMQTDLIQKEARGEKTEIGLLMVHAQDHLMTAGVVLDMAKEFIALYRLMASK